MIFSHSRQRVAALLIATVASVSLAACDNTARPKYEQRLATDDFVIRVSVESLPVRALETIRYRVVVSDAKTGKPIDNGEGRIYATNADRKTTANGLEYTGELGTYRSTLFLVTSGLWAMAVQFRRDSTQKLQATADWTQDVQVSLEPGEIQTPSSDRIDRDSVKRADSLSAADSARKADSAKAPPAAIKP